MNLKNILSLIFIFSILPSLNSFGQTKPSTEESIIWINEKLTTYSSDQIKIQKVQYSPATRILAVFDARGEMDTFFSKQIINIDFIGSISIRQEDDFYAIDIFPKEGRSCGAHLLPFFGEPFDYPGARTFIQNDNFPISKFTSLGHIQITLKSTSDHDQVPQRITKALFQILENNGITLQKEVF